MANSACSYCGRKGILIYPVRYAVACPKGKSNVPGLSGNFKITGAPSDIAPAKFSLRALRTGYLYVYEERRKRLKAYIVLPNGALWEFPVEYIPTVDVNRMDFCCLDRVSVALSYFIDVEPLPCGIMGNVWIGWSNILWTKKSMASVSNPDWRWKHMQRIDMQAMVDGSEVHTARFKDYSENIPHLSCNEDALHNAFDFSNAPTQREMRSPSIRKSIEQVLRERCPYGGFIIAVNDPVGVCSDLGELTLPTDDAGFDERCCWGKISSNLLESLETAVNDEARERERKRANFEKTERNAVVNAYDRWSRSVANLNSRVLRKATNAPVPKDAWSEYISENGKPLVDLDAAKRFSADYDKAAEKFEPIAIQFDKYQTAWLRCEQLGNWMHGVHDPNDIRSGIAFRESLAQCIGNSAGNQYCSELLKRWLAEDMPSDERNLYARGLLFNHNGIIAATVPHIKKSDIPLEGIFNIYKRAVEIVSKDGTLNVFDRLALSTVNVLVSSFGKGASNIARNLTLVGLSLTAEVIIRPSTTNVNEIQKWILRECRGAGVEFNESKLKTWVSANKAAKAAIDEYKNSAASMAIELDIEQLRQQGRISPDALHVVKIPGIDQARRWISSDAPAEFKLGSVTIILQLIAVSFAMRDWVGNDATNRFETRWKAGFGAVTVLSSVVEVAMATLHVRSTHPLSSFLKTHWKIDQAKAYKRMVVARGVGLIASLAVACLDIWKGLGLIWEKSYLKGLFYVTSGTVTAGLAVLAFKGAIAFWWLIAAAVIFSLVASLLNEVALKEWIAKSFFGTGKEKFRTIDDELNAYRKALEG